MRKRMKIRKWIKRCLLTLLILIFAFIVFHNLLRIVESKKQDGPYKYVELEHGNVHVYDSKEGQETLVFLSGFRTGSPILDFMPLAKQLEDNYRVIIIEYLGYGYSEVTDADRTVENITEEIHETLSNLNVEEYYLLPHSISGIYTYYYCDLYSDEVKGIIGLDSTIPSQLEGKDIPGATILDILLEKSGAVRLASYLISDAILPENMDAYYSREDQKELLDMTVRTYNNKNHIDEMNRYKENVDKVMAIELPKKISVLHIISAEVHDDPEEWIRFHQEAATKQEKGQVVNLCGTHYLHRQIPDEIAQIIKDFIEEN